MSGYRYNESAGENLSSKMDFTFVTKTGLEIDKRLNS